ncbi:MAG: YbhB/YbcL family Raf kinase inhibitor-like protein [Bacteriovoracia bacterium]
MIETLKELLPSWLCVTLCFQIFGTVLFNKKLEAVMTTEHFEISSPYFKNDSTIPKKYTGDGENRSPHLKWTGVPKGAQELLLIVEDPDAPGKEPFIHWIVYHIPASTNELPEGFGNSEPPAPFKFAKNSFGKFNYGGPLPPRGHGLHHYHFRVYALSHPVDIEPTINRSSLLKAIRGYVLLSATLIGTYERMPQEKPVVQ